MRTPADRPLSPHLQVYRLKYTMVLSGLHRMSGLYLTATAPLYVGWLLAAALGPGPYQCAARFFASLPIRIVLALSLAAFWYHLFAGIRHLAWDAGFGFERRAAQASGRIMFAAAAIAFVATLAFTPAGRFLAGLS